MDGGDWWGVIGCDCYVGGQCLSWYEPCVLVATAVRDGGGRSARNLGVLTE